MARPDRAARPATYEDLVKVPDHLVAEILDGELYATPRPAPRHAAASSALVVLLGGPFDHGRGGPGGWRILFEPELHLGNHVAVPDVAGWRRERMPALPERAYWTEAPDWLCEVLSPSTAAIDRAKKLAIYARERVAHVRPTCGLSIQLPARSKSCGSAPVAGRSFQFSPSEITRAEPFEAIELDLSLVFNEPRSEPQP